MGTSSQLGKMAEEQNDSIAAFLASFAERDHQERLAASYKHLDKLLDQDIANGKETEKLRADFEKTKNDPVFKPVLDFFVDPRTTSEQRSRIMDSLKKRLEAKEKKVDS